MSAGASAFGSASGLSAGASSVVASAGNLDETKEQILQKAHAQAQNIASKLPAEATTDDAPVEKADAEPKADAPAEKPDAEPAKADAPADKPDAE